MAVINYDAWARTYDQTRGASPSVLQPIAAALGPPGGRSLLDLGGGTGNFALPLAQSGFRVSVLDFSGEMCRRALAKLPGSLVVNGDGQCLPFRDGSFECGMSINVLGHMPDWRVALREARRVLRDGPLVLKVSTRETLSANWVMQYFPALIDNAPLHHYQPSAETVQALRDAGFARVDVAPIHYSDAADGSIQAVKHQPELFLDDSCVANIAAFMRVPEPERSRGLQQIRDDHRSGRLADVIAGFQPLVEKYGDGFVFTARP
jgi:ubiquinone/menaquinone biosynthesis C-methylase UbiE